MRMAIRKPLPSPQKSRYHGKRMSAREFLALPEEKPYLEYIDGVVEQKPMVNADHSQLVGRLDGHFFVYSEAHGGGFGPEARVSLNSSGDYFLPDTAFWAKGWPRGDDATPTVAVEVRSPRQPLHALRAKCQAYLRDGSEAAWLIDPVARTIEVFDHEGSRTLKAADVLTCGAMPGFELPLSSLFSILDR